MAFARDDTESGSTGLSGIVQPVYIDVVYSYACIV